MYVLGSHLGFLCCRWRRLCILVFQSQNKLNCSMKVTGSLSAYFRIILEKASFN